VSTVDRDGGWQRAGFVSRVSADLIDAFLVCIGALAVVLVAAMLGALFGGSRLTLPRADRVGTAGILSIAFVVYLTFFWSATGRTPGKQVAGLRVLTSTGAPLSIARAAARAIMCVVFPIGLVWVLFGRHNLALHDLILRTAVVYDWSAHTPEHGREPAANGSSSAGQITTDPAREG
jgi:uncharacterized RDD family membrane protein YckC